MMDLQTRKINLIQDFIHINNNSILNLIENIIKKSTPQKTDIANPFSDKIFFKRLEKSLEDIDSGRVTAIKDLEKEMKSW
jgi:hypothetical protein